MIAAFLGGGIIALQAKPQSNEGNFFLDSLCGSLVVASLISSIRL
jgi:hypothetical protein